MDIIIGGRGTGKTKQLFETARRNGGVILAWNKRATQIKAHEYGYDNLEIVDYEDLHNDDFPLGKKFYVLNGHKFLEWLMDRYYNIELGGFTANTNVKE